MQIEDEFTHAEENLQSRLEQWRGSEPAIDGSWGRLVPQEWAEPSAYSYVARPAGSFVTEWASKDTIRTEKDRLIATAKAQGFFWDADTEYRICAALLKHQVEGGSEHDDYLVGESPNQVVIRNTANGIYGVRADTSPAQYLQRLDEYNRTFPILQMRLIGVSEDADGNAVIWTAQPFVYGEEFGSQAELEQAMETRGWRRDGYPGIPRFLHEATGAIIEDAHTGNILHRDGELFPIDVQMEALPEQPTDGLDARA